MSQNFAVLEPVSQAIYSASFDLDIQIPLSASLIYRDTGYCQKYTVNTVAVTQENGRCSVALTKAFLTAIKSYI